MTSNRKTPAATVRGLRLKQCAVANADVLLQSLAQRAQVKLVPASGPIPKFASARVTFRCELRNLRTTSNFMILVRF